MSKATTFLSDGNRYTIVALPDDKGGATMRIVRDEVVPDSGKARDSKAYTIVLTRWQSRPVEVITFDDSETGGVAGLSLH